MDPKKALDQILHRLDPETKGREILARIRVAEMTYRIQFPFPKTFDEFRRECAEYWNHLHKHYYRFETDLPEEHAYSFATRAMDSAFESDGGWRYAQDLAQRESFGAVQGALTGGFIMVVTRDLDSVATAMEINPGDHDERKALTEEFGKRFNIHFETEGEFWTCATFLERNLAAHVQREEAAKKLRKYGFPS